MGGMDVTPDIGFAGEWRRVKSLLGLRSSSIPRTAAMRASRRSYRGERILGLRDRGGNAMRAARVVDAMKVARHRRKNARPANRLQADCLLGCKPRRARRFISTAPAAAISPKLKKPGLLASLSALLPITTAHGRSLQITDEGGPPYNPAPRQSPRRHRGAPGYVRRPHPATRSVPF